jgi:hypothetical protein
MMAKVIWNMKNTVSGRDPDNAAVPTPPSNAFDNPPIQGLSAPPSPNARL